MSGIFVRRETCLPELEIHVSEKYALFEKERYFNVAWLGTHWCCCVFWRNHYNTKGFLAFYLLIKLWDSSDPITIASPRKYLTNTISGRKLNKN